MAHTGVWPSYQHVRTRTLAALDPDGTLYTASGAVLGRSLGYEAVKEIALSERLDLYVTSLKRECWADFLLDAIDDPGARVLCSQSGGIVALAFLGGGNRAASVAQAVSWEPHAEAGIELLGDVAAVSALLGAGTYVSPGALGEAHWRAARADCPGVSVPSVACRSRLLSHLVGGRADTPALGESFALAYESDMRSAYPALSVGVPCGTAGRMLHELDGDACATYFAQCVVDVPSRLDGFSPVALPVALARGDRDRPANDVRRLFRLVPGRYTLWLWREEVEAARSIRLTVSVGAGYYWRRWDYHNRTWLSRLALARREAPSDQILRLAKRAGVAAIGRHGMPEASYELITEEHADPEHDTPIAGEVGGSPIMGLWLRAVTDGPPPRRLPHWYSFILAKCRLALWRRMEAERSRGNRPLLSNFDSVITLGPPTEPTTTEDIPGTWKQSELHDLRIVAPRSYTSVEKTVLPGVRR